MNLRTCIFVVFIVSSFFLLISNVFFNRHVFVLLDKRKGIGRHVSSTEGTPVIYGMASLKTPYPNLTLNTARSKNDHNAYSKWRQQEQLLTVPMIGRLGNQMFQYASLLGIALRNGKRPFVSRHNLVRTVFNVSYIEEINTTNWSEAHEGRYAAYDPQFESLPQGNMKILQYLQSWRYFSHVENLVRNEFKFSKRYFELGKRSFKEHTSMFTNRTIVALHVRRADMMKEASARKGYTTAPLSYIRKAVSHMKVKFRNPAFLISTDDKAWCKTYLNNPDTVILNNKNPFVDFVAMTFCDHMIMTVGTFGWWAAWLIDGYTVYYKDYPKPGRKIARGFEKRDYFLPHWVPM